MPQRNEDTDTEDADSEGESDAEGVDEEEEEVLPTEEESNNEPDVRTVIVKADSGKILPQLLNCDGMVQQFSTLYIPIDITLSTLFDRYGDEEEAHKLAREAGATGPELTRVLQWGLGEIGLSDVNLASAGDGEYVSFFFCMLSSRFRFPLARTVALDQNI